MTVQRKIHVLLFSTFLVLFLGFLRFQQIERERSELLQSLSSHQASHSLERGLVSLHERHRHFLSLVSETMNETVLTALARTLDGEILAVAILDSSRNVKFAWPGEPVPTFFPAKWDHDMEYYEAGDGELIEICAKRITPDRIGWLRVRVDSAYLSLLSRRAGAPVHITFTPSTDDAPRLPFADRSGRFVAAAVIQATPQSEDIWTERSRQQVYVFIACAVIVLLMWGVALSYWISRPLRKILESLKHESIEPIRPLLKTETEFAFVSDLIARFLDQKSYLMDEVSRRIRSEKSLKRSEADYRELFENAQDAMVIADAKTREIVSANVSAATMYDLDLNRLIGRKLDSLWKNTEAFESWWNHLTEHVTSKGEESEHVRPDQRPLIVDINAAQLAYRDKKCVLLVMREITEEKLLEDMRLSHAIWQHIPKMAFVLDAKGETVFATGNIENLLGYTSTEMRGDGFYALFPGINVEGEKDRLRRIAMGEFENEKPYERLIRRRDGTDAWFLWFEVRAPGNLVICVGHDETEQRLARQTIEESEDRYRTLFEYSPTPLLVLDKTSWRILSVNRAATDLYGYPANEFAGRDFTELIDAESGASVVVRAGYQKHRRRDGTILDVECAFHGVRLGQMETRIALILDVSQHLRAQFAEFELEKQKIRIAAMVEAIEEERRRISKELHDSVGQILTAIKRDLENVQRKATGKAVERLDAIQTLVQSAIGETRQIAYNLMPAALEHLGLVDAVEGLCRQVQHHAGLTVTFKSYGWTVRHSRSLELALFRMVQEAVNNIVKHAQASDVSVQMIAYPEKLMVLIEDNGVGFSPSEEGPKPHERSGLGLVSIRERAAMHRGHVYIDSRKGRGTSLIIEIPIGENEYVKN